MGPYPYRHSLLLWVLGGPQFTSWGGFSLLLPPLLLITSSHSLLTHALGYSPPNPVGGIPPQPTPLQGEVTQVMG